MTDAGLTEVEDSKDGSSGQTFEERQQEIKDHELRLEELNTLKHRYFLKFKEVQTAFAYL